MRVLEEVVGLRAASGLPTLDFGCREVEHLHVSLTRLILPAADHGGRHDLLFGAENVNAHRVASQLHPETVDVRQTDNKVKLIQVDDHKRDLLAEGGANVQKYPHLPLRRLKRPIAIHNAKMMCSRMHGQPMPFREGSIDEGDAGAGIVEPHTFGAGTAASQISWNLQQAVPRRPRRRPRRCIALGCLHSI